MDASDFTAAIESFDVGLSMLAEGDTGGTNDAIMRRPAGKRTGKKRRASEITGGDDDDDAQGGGDGGEAPPELSAEQVLFKELQKERSLSLPLPV